MKLLERDYYLHELQNKYDNLSDGNGFVVLISGEAGVGKTSLIEAFLNKINDKANILWGACDDLFTPRPLGPLYDIAAQLNDNLLKLLDNHAERVTIFTRFLKELQDNSFPNILIIEDIHWADESTLDLIKYLGRRTNRINSLFIITYRDDEIGPEHPLRFVLGDISSKNLNKFKLTALSEKTVNELANSNGIKNLFQITWGNPFLITELLSNKGEGVPSTIKDSVLTRISRLTNKAREFVELISIIPTRAEKWVINDIISINSKILDECVNSGILKTETECVSFKHELSRMAVEEFLSDSKKFELNEAVLQTLLKQKNTESYLARIIHHAIKADNKEVIINYASAAAK
ncbi:MAG: AAA family ATPase, partial [Ignavibacteriaceae bacterium]